MDFDGEDIREAVDDAIACIKYFESEFGYPVEAMRIFLTGGRGVHIEIPAVTFGAEEGDPNLIYIYKTIIETLPFKTLDRSVYNQKKGRMWRLPNQQRSNGRYKVPVSVQELMNTPYDELWALTEKPRHDFQI